MKRISIDREWELIQGEPSNLPVMAPKSRIVHLPHDFSLSLRSMPGPHTHACRDTSQILGIQFYGIPEREEQPDDIWEVSIPEPEVLVQMVLRLHCRQNAKKIEEYI